MNEQPWRVLFLNPASQLGGAERSLLSLVSRLNPRHFQTCVLLCVEGPLEGELARLGISFHRLPFPKIALRVGRTSSLQNLFRLAIAFFAQIPFWIRLIVFVRRGGFDLIHTNGVKSHLHGCLIKLFLRKRLVWHVRDIFAPGLFTVMLLVLGGLFPEAIIANSGATAQPFLQSRRTRRKIQVIYNGFDFSEWAPRSSRPELESRLGL
ncbi:MAG: glycosyltransferase, partial [Candidatus Binatia bacterium]